MPKRSRHALRRILKAHYQSYVESYREKPPTDLVQRLVLAQAATMTADALYWLRSSKKASRRHDKWMAREVDARKALDAALAATTATASD